MKCQDCDKPALKGKTLCNSCERKRWVDVIQEEGMKEKSCDNCAHFEICNIRQDYEWWSNLPKLIGQSIAECERLLAKLCQHYKKA
jgi:hypothetical protein